MREIRFRARMNGHDKGHGGIFVYMRGLDGVWFSKNGRYYGELIPGSEEQYTGRSDGKGQKCYAGDIVAAAGWDGWIIVWHNDGWMIQQGVIDNFQKIPEHFNIYNNIHEDTNA